MRASISGAVTVLNMYYLGFDLKNDSKNEGALISGS